MASVPIDFPGLTEVEANADKTAELLAKAAQQVSALVPNERWAEQAERLRQAATYANVAAAELNRSVGWYEAAAAASEAGLLDSEESDSG
jgi:hypothetical protein